MITLKQMAAALKKIPAGSRIAVCGHTSADPDSLTSMALMHLFLKELGHQSLILTVKKEVERADIFPYNPSFMKEYNEVMPERGQPVLFDAFVMLDLNDTRRLGRFEQIFQSASQKFCLDHHILPNAEPCENFYSRPESVAAAEVMFDLFKTAEVPLSTEAAELVFMGMANDTVSFTKNMGEKQFTALAELARMGINTTALAARACHNITTQEMKFTLYVLSKLKHYKNGCYFGFIKEVAFHKLNNGNITLDRTVNTLQSLKDVNILFLAKVLRSGEISGSFRSSCDVDVNEVAALLGGGGHKKASGFKTSMSKKEVWAIVENFFKENYMYADK